MNALSGSALYSRYFNTSVSKLQAIVPLNFGSYKTLPDSGVLDDIDALVGDSVAPTTRSPGKEVAVLQLPKNVVSEEEAQDQIDKDIKARKKILDTHIKDNSAPKRANIARLEKEVIEAMEKELKDSPSNKRIIILKMAQLVRNGVQAQQEKGVLLDYYYKYHHILLPIIEKYRVDQVINDITYTNQPARMLWKD